MEPTTQWSPTDGNGEYTFPGTSFIVDPNANFLVDPAGNFIVDTGVGFSPVPATVWITDDSK